MSWLYFSDPDREAERDALPESGVQAAQAAVKLPPRRPVKGFAGRYQFVLPGFDHLIQKTPYKARIRRAG